ncbi:hypothetical protein KJ909_00630, partial [Patescibacteria group bacterium]|nr:hypothetical protein [Patescibacteria group bacterium]
MIKILVLTDDMPWGHRSIARAIYGYLKTKEKENSWKIEYAEVKAKTAGVADFYNFLYRYWPASNRVLHKMSFNKGLGEVYREMSIFNLPNLKKLVEKNKPDLIICCYLWHSRSLVEWRKKEDGCDFKLWTVVADPWSVNAISYLKEADLHLVYDQVGEKVGLRLGISKDKMLKTGWWVREEMYEEKWKVKSEKLKVKRRLGFTDDRPVIFVGGGSLGTSALPKLLPALLLVKKPVGVVINTGADKMAFKMVANYIKLFSNFKKKRELVKIKNLGWIDNMAEVLTVCDIVFGKAGPNFLFDVMAVGKPFVAITHIGGQED